MPFKFGVEMEMLTRAVNSVSRRYGEGAGWTYESNASCNEQAEGRDAVHGSGASGIGDGTASSSWSSDDTTIPVSQYSLRSLRQRFFFGSGTHVEAMVELATPAAVEEEDGQA